MKPRFLLLLTMLTSVPALNAAALRKAQFTRIMNDVKVVPEQQQPLPAKVGDSVSGNTAVSTGVQSRAELRFEDNTITRLGANCLFSLDEGSRTVDLKQGTILLQVPKGLGGARVRTAAITAVITGTTVMVEYNAAGVAKFIVLEGQMDVFRNDNRAVFITLKAGDLLATKPANPVFPAAVQVDLKRLKQTSQLMDDKTFGALGNQKFLKEADDQQKARIKDGELQETSLVMKNKVEFPDLKKRIDLVPKKVVILPPVAVAAPAPPRPSTPVVTGPAPVGVNSGGGTGGRGGAGRP